LATKLEKSPDLKQKRVLARLAAQYHVPVAEITTLFETERSRLVAGAHITKFLDVFATRHVLETLQLRAEAEPIPTSAQPERTHE
jgi:hypothetical protein